FFCREEQLLLTFSRRGHAQLKLNRASPASQSAESAGRLFSVWCSSACRSTCKLRDLKSPAPIPDPSVFCDCQVRNRTLCGILSPIFRRSDYSSLITSKTVFRVASINCTEISRN